MVRIVHVQGQDYSLKNTNYRNSLTPSQVSNSRSIRFTVVSRTGCPRKKSPLKVMYDFLDLLDLLLPSELPSLDEGKVSCFVCE